GAGGARGVVEQRLVPLRRGVVDVDGGRGRLDGREAVVVKRLLFLPPPLVAALVENSERLLLPCLCDPNVGERGAIRWACVPSVLPIPPIVVEPEARLQIGDDFERFGL